MVPFNGTVISIWRCFKIHAASCWECDFTVFRAKSQSGSNSKSRSGMSDGADEIATYSSSSSSMNFAGDIAQLSYKELQALALRYRVPGNVKVSCHRRRDTAVVDRPSLYSSVSILSFVVVFSLWKGAIAIEITTGITDPQAYHGDGVSKRFDISKPYLIAINRISDSLGTWFRWIRGILTKIDYIRSRRNVRGIIVAKIVPIMTNGYSLRDSVRMSLSAYSFQAGQSLREG